MSGLAPVSDLPVRSLTPREDLLRPWRERKDQAVRHRKRFEAQWMTSQHFAAGKQWVEYAPRRHRVLVPELPRGRSRQTADVLTRYVWTVIGELAATEFRPQFLFSQNDVESEDTADIINKGLAYGWDQEWDGDTIVHDILLKLVVFGTAAIRCRYDRSQGPLIGKEIPHKNGTPILDPGEQAQYMHQQFVSGQEADLRPVREGKVVWEALSPWNMLPPPGIEHDRDFPWELIVRPVHVDTLKAIYGNAAAGIKSAGIESMDTLGLNEASNDSVGDRSAQGNSGVLEDHVLVYTGYLFPSLAYPDGQTVVFTDTRLLDASDSLPYPEGPGRPASSGVTYFKYWPVPQRFWGRGFIEPGIGPQRARNKRLTQKDEIIDRGLPKVYVERGTLRRLPEGLAMEVVEVEPNKRPPQTDQGVAPGAWMYEDIRQMDEDIEKALGVNLVSLGENPSGVQTYSQLALLRENDFKKLGPVAQRLSLSLIKVSEDSLEAMRNWPPDKRLYVVGDDDTLELLEFSSSKIPRAYLATAVKSSATPHSEAAELQKITDVWNAALAVSHPLPLSWYVDSINAGKMENLPDDQGDEQRHKAQIENHVMTTTGQPVPVEPWDNVQVHIPEHRREQAVQSQKALLGDQQAAQLVQVIEAHNQQHLAVAAANIQAAAPTPNPQQLQAGPQPAGPVPQGPPPGA